MEIAAPSIETQLKVTHAILCVPYFPSPEGKHAKIDVPNLIRDARIRLDEEGLLEYDDDDDDDDYNANDNDNDVGSGSKRRMVEIYTTKSVGSNVECMPNVVNDLVRVALEERVGGDM